MEKKNAIEVKNITKKFRVYPDKGYTLKEKTLFRRRRAYEERNVLDHISFEVRKGEAVGLIGQNGCGKSTTLKLLTKIMYPDSGEIEMRGRVSSLIELGAGFHPDMSGRENIYINASIFGLTRKEIEERMGDIIRFSELEAYIDNPVRTYSSGMYMRLAFSVAINVDADILLIDEILAVGDAGFQVKCLNRLKEIKADGTTIVLVSHSMGQIEQICDRSIWIHEGGIMADGKPRDIYPQYLDYMDQQRRTAAEKEESSKKEGQIDKDSKEEQKKRPGNGKIRVESVQVLNEEGKETTGIKTDAAMTIRIAWRIKEPVKDVVFGIEIFRGDGVLCYGTNTRIDKTDLPELRKDGIIRLEMDPVALLPGNYFVNVSAECGMGVLADDDREACRFEVFSLLEDTGLVRLKHRWTITDEEE